MSIDQIHDSSVERVRGGVLLPARETGRSRTGLRMIMNTRTVGTEKEKTAAAFLMERGCRVLAVNFRCRIGEIDLIVSDPRGQLRFVEVKYRRDGRKGAPEEAVNSRKQHTISRVSDYYRVRCSVPEGQACRFDVVAITGDHIEWIQDAFDYIPC